MERRVGRADASMAVTRWRLQAAQRATADRRTRRTTRWRRRSGPVVGGSGRAITLATMRLATSQAPSYTGLLPPVLPAFRSPRREFRPQALLLREGLFQSALRGIARLVRHGGLCRCTVRVIWVGAPQISDDGRQPALQRRRCGCGHRGLPADARLKVGGVLKDAIPRERPTRAVQVGREGRNEHVPASK